MLLGARQFAEDAVKQPAALTEINQSGQIVEVHARYT